MVSYRLPVTMKTWITSIGISHHAVVNSLWACVAENGWIPERVYILTNDRTKKDVVEISTKIEKIVMHHGGTKPEFMVRLFSETDLEGLFSLYTGIISDETNEDNEISVDITPGRKFMSAFALYCSLNNRICVRNIFYFHLMDDEFMDRPYPFIPANAYCLRNLVEFGEAVP